MPGLLKRTARDVSRVLGTGKHGLRFTLEEPVMTDELVPIDLEARMAFFAEPQGSSSDPESLEYGGLLNLLGVGRGRPCSLHPEHTITWDGCQRCHAIHEHRKARRQAAAALDETDRGHG